MQSFELFKTGSVGNGRAYALNQFSANKVAIEFEVEAVGATPTVTFNIQGLAPGGDPTDANHWSNLAMVQADSTVAASPTGVTVTAVGKTFRWVAGEAFDDRFFDGLAINITANTNITFRSALHRQDRTN